MGTSADRLYEHGEVLWRVVRADDISFTEERFVRRSDGIWYEAGAVPDGLEPTQEPLTLRAGPWPSEEIAAGAHPEALVMSDGDRVLAAINRRDRSLLQRQRVSEAR